MNKKYMKVYSWNMLFCNRETDRAFAFIAESDFDIFCLQEVPEEFLARLQTLPCFIAFRTERELLLKEGTVHNYAVILSKHPITAQGEIPFPDYERFIPLRTRLFFSLMRPFHFSTVRNRSGLYADVMMNKQVVRVFNLHLPLTRPSWRLKEFERAMAERNPSRPTIVCGDFNILEAPRITILNWLLGGRVSDTVLYRRERTHIEKRFVEHELTNPLKGEITHPLSRSQLDHILLSHHLKVAHAEVIPDRYGSDHHPILVSFSHM